MKKVIIIDDSSLQLNILKSMFEKASWEVHETKNPEEVLPLIYQIAPDLIITDAIMPRIGGFELLKIIKENKIISKIPVIIYSILTEDVAKLYLNKYGVEYFLSKDKTTNNELIEFANQVHRKKMLSNEYKREIIIAGRIEAEKKAQNKEKTEEVEKTKEVIATTQENTKISLINELKNLKDTTNFNKDNEEIIFNCLSKLDKIINYNLAIISVFDNDEENSMTYFDIKNIILNPNFQRNLIINQKTKKPIFKKKYSPNLPTIQTFDDFSSKITFEIEHIDKKITEISFYSLEKNIAKEFDENELKNILIGYFKTRYIKKNANKNKAEGYSNATIDKLTSDLELKHKETTYLAILNISNYNELSNYISVEELDFLNIKITQKIQDYLSFEEKIFKEKEDEYILLVFEKSYDEIIKRLKNINMAINSIEFEGLSPKISLGVSNCYINNHFDILEARKIAKDVLENIQEEKTQIEQ